MMFEVIFLGTGASTGVPVIACRCKTCTSKSRFNTRLRPSILIKFKGKNILVDVGPDIRQQALKYEINTLDALIITHVHYDHIAGIDDLRIYNRKQEKNIDCYLLEETYKELKERYDYIFKRNDEGHTQSAKFDFHVLSDQKKVFKFDDIIFNYFSFFQDHKKVLGIRLGNFAYVTDIKTYNETIFNELKNLDVLVLSCLKKKTSDVHFNLKEVIDFSKKVNPKITYLTHLAHEVEHNSFLTKDAKNIKLAYDGLKLKF
jgi:phosphoribosyl 1,2-cyclic phosphate phosphodiesterase